MSPSDTLRFPSLQRALRALRPDALPAGARHLDNSHDAEVRNLLRVDLLPAPSALDRLQSAAYELVLDGECSRRRQKPGQGRPTHPHRPPT